MDNLLLLVCSGLVLYMAFQAGRWYQKFTVALRLVKFVHDDEAWDLDCRETRELVWGIRDKLRLLPWWRH